MKGMIQREKIHGNCTKWNAAYEKKNESNAIIFSDGDDVIELITPNNNEHVKGKGSQTHPQYQISVKYSSTKWLWC